MLDLLRLTWFLAIFLHFTTPVRGQKPDFWLIHRLLNEPLVDKCDVAFVFKKNEMATEFSELLNTAANNSRPITIFSGLDAQIDAIRLNNCLFRVVFGSTALYDVVISKALVARQTRKGQYYAFWPHPPVEDLNTIIENRDTFDLINWRLIVPNEKTITIWTHCRHCPPPNGKYQTFEANSTYLRRVNIWNKERRQFVLPGRIFENPPVNLNGHLVRVGHGIGEIVLPQFVAYELVNGSVVKLGSEVQFVEYLGRMLNFSVELVQTIDGKYGALVDKKNNKWNGIIGMVIARQIDFGIGGFGLTLARHLAIDYTRSHDFAQMSGLLFYTAKPGFLPKWQALYWPFGNFTWIFSIVALLVHGTVVYLFAKVAFKKSPYTIGLSYMESVQLFFGKGKSNIPTEDSFRIFITGWMFFCMIITLAYSSMLMASLTLPAMTKPLYTFEELAKSGYEISMPSGTRYTSLLKQYAAEGTDPILGKIQETLNSQDQEKSYSKNVAINIEGFVNNKRHAVLSTIGMYRKLRAGMFGESIKFEEVHISRERLFSSGRACPFRKAAPLLDPVTVGMQRIMENGLLFKFEDEFFRQRAELSRKNLLKKSKRQLGTGKRQEEESNQTKVLDIDTLQGAFFCFVIGLLLSIVAFACEITVGIWYRYKEEDWDAEDTKNVY